VENVKVRKKKKAQGIGGMTQTKQNRQKQT
jgi:hypothetical protein